MKLLLVLLTLAPFLLFSEIISLDRRIDWNPGIPDDYPEKTFQVDVMDFGAVGDGQTDDTNAFISAINANCHTRSRAVLPVDMFPPTAHIECVTHFERRD